MNQIDRENMILYEKLLNIHSKPTKRVDTGGNGKWIVGVIVLAFKESARRAIAMQLNRRSKFLKI
jgi:hypothetical protein